MKLNLSKTSTRKSSLIGPGFPSLPEAVPELRAPGEAKHLRAPDREKLALPVRVARLDHPADQVEEAERLPALDMLPDREEQAVVLLGRRGSAAHG